MKKGKFFKRAALAAAICLSLTQSVWAMPTGGAVVGGGNVTVNDSPFISGDLANGASVVVNAPSIINWSAFGIAEGESLTFNTAGGSLLNRVTGDNVSEIFGTLTQTGGCALYLVNPNGILVGNGAIINATNMVLSTLDITENGMYSAGTGINMPQYAKFEKSLGQSKAAAITIKGNAKINVLNREDAVDPGPESGAGMCFGNFAAVGGTVEVADGVTFSVNNQAQAQLVAADTASVSLGNGMWWNDDVPIEGTEKNLLSFKNSTAQGIGPEGYEWAHSSSGSILLQGGAIDVSNSAFEIGGIAVQSRTREGEMLPNNVVNINKSEYNSLQTTIEGGKIDVTDSNLSADLGMIAAHTKDENGDWAIAPQNTVSITRTNINGSDTSSVFIAGSKVNVTSSNLKSTSSDAPDANFTHNTWTIMAGESTGKYTSRFTSNDSYSETDYRLGDASHSVVLKDTAMDIAGDQTIFVAGGKVTLDGATLKSGDNIVIAAADDAKYTQTSLWDNEWHLIELLEEWNGTASANNLVSILGGTSINATNKAAIAGGKVSITGKSIISAGNKLSVKAGSAGRMRDEVIELTGTPGEIEISSDSKLLQNGVDITNNVLNGNTAIDTSINKSDKENIAIGQAAMDALLSSGKDVDAMLKATRELVQGVNKDTSVGKRAQAAQIVGVLFAILNDDSLSATEKTWLNRTVLNTFAPTLNALIAALNLQSK